MTQKIDHAKKSFEEWGSRADRFSRRVQIFLYGFQKRKKSIYLFIVHLVCCTCASATCIPYLHESGAKKCTLFEIGRKKCLLFSAIKKLWQGTSVSVLLTWHQVNENITLCFNTDSLSSKIVNLTPPQFTYLPFLSFILSQGLSFFNSPGIIIRQVPFSHNQRLCSFFVLV